MSGAPVDRAIGRGGFIFGRRSVSADFLKAGLLRLQVLNYGDKPAAAVYAFTSRRRTFLYLGGFAPEFEKFSPGTVLIGHTIEQAIEAADLEVDFLRGAEAYKYTWGAHDRATYRLTLGA